MKKFLRSVLSAEKGSVSSKRVAGLIGFMLCLILVVYCTFSRCEAPTLMEHILYVSAALLGLDTVTRAFNKSSNNEHYE